jgi:polygalacturonase
MLYITPDPQLSDSKAIQQAVNTAAAKDIRTVVIPATKTWHLETPV